jgi:hypothetical protein
MKTIPASSRAHYLARLRVFLITAALIAGTVGCGPILPPPSPSRNLEIRDWYDLNAVRDNLAGNHTLMNDLDSTTRGYEELASPTANGGKGWEPIGSFHVYPFTGTFNGQGYEIRDLFINRPDECAVGLFNGVGEGGHIEGVGVVNANVTGSLEAVWHGCDSAGSLVGINLGTVNNSYSTGSVICEWDVGGLVGENSGTVSNSYYSGNVTGKASGGAGLVGANSGTVINSYYNYDEVLINGENIVTIGALFSEDFDGWLANDKFIDVNERLPQENGYYLINDVSDFKQLLAFGQNGTLKFRLTNDLDLGDEANFYIPYLAGEFDGNGHKILNLSFNFGFVYHVGLFGYLAPGGKVTQVGVENVNITGADFAGGLVGDNHQGTVSNCYATGSVTRNEDIGGLAGRSNGAGGLVGRSNGIVSDSYFSGSVTGEGDVGGLVGTNVGTVSNSYSTGTMSGTWGTGGLVGSNWRGTVVNCYSTGNVTGDSWVGGLVGRNDALKDSGEGTVSNSYSTGSVTGTWGVGGLMGGNGEGTVSNSYSTGSVTGNDDVGGLVGANWDGTVTDSFWDTETSGQATSDGGTGKTTAEMQDIATFTDAGWNIIAVANPGARNPSHIWNIVDGVTYPFLSWQD